MSLRKHGIDFQTAALVFEDDLQLEYPDPEHSEFEERYITISQACKPSGKERMPNITPHVCRHTYCSNQAKAGMNPKTLQYLMGHSDIGVTLNVYTHLGLEDAAAEMARMEEVETARKEQEKISGKKDRENKVTQKMFRAV